jgi:predicted porin
MKRTLIAAALSTLAVGAAHADYNLYGLIDMSYGKSVVDDALGLKPDFHSGGDSGSGEGNSTTRFGIKGSTDVGSGIKANFKLETGGITSDGSVNPGGAFFNRQAWLGFSGDFGEVRLGRQDSVAFQTMIDYDFNGASNGVSSGCWAQVGTWGACDLGRQSRSLQYISPTMGGLKVQLGFQPEGNDPGAKANFAAAVTYANGPLSVSATVQSKLTDDGAKFGAVAGSYDFGFVKLMAGYTDGKTGVKGYSAGFTAPIAGVNIGALYGKNSDTKGDALEVFVNKEVLKNTYAYFEVGNANSKAMKAITGGAATNSGTGYALGVIYTF